MRTLLVVIPALLVGCVTEQESSVTGASGVDPIYMRLEGVKGESTSGRHEQWISVAFLDTTATVVYGTDCIGLSCAAATTATAHLQSGVPTLDGPSSMWKFDDGQLHVGVKGDPASDPTVSINFGGHGFTPAMQAQLVTCAPAPDCLVIKGRICVPICTPL
jgi:hypothetical protein